MGLSNKFSPPNPLRPVRSVPVVTLGRGHERRDAELEDPSSSVRVCQMPQQGYCECLNYNTKKISNTSPNRWWPNLCKVVPNDEVLMSVVDTYNLSYYTSKGFNTTVSGEIFFRHHPECDTLWNLGSDSGWLRTGPSLFGSEVTRRDGTWTVLDSQTL